MCRATQLPKFAYFRAGTDTIDWLRRPSWRVPNREGAMASDESGAPPYEAHRALVLHDRAVITDLIELTLNHGLFVVRATRTLAEALTVLDEWQPHIAVIDMDHDDSTELLHKLGASNSLRPSVTPVLGLTRRGDLPTKLKAFDLGVRRSDSGNPRRLQA